MNSLRNLTDIEWLKLAVAKRDQPTYKSALSAIHAREQWMEATDGYRLHVAWRGDALPVGTWRTDAPGPWTPGAGGYTTAYPDTSKVITAEPPAWQWQALLEEPRIRELVGLCEATVAAEKYVGKLNAAVTLPVANGETARFNARYVLDVVRGLASPADKATVYVYCNGKHEACAWWSPELRRLAYVMPVRFADYGTTPPRLSFRLDDALTPIQTKEDHGPVNAVTAA